MTIVPASTVRLRKNMICQTGVVTTSHFTPAS